MGKLTEALMALFGMVTQEREDPEVVAITVAAVRVFKVDNDRVALYICNLGANDAYLSLDETVSATHGIVLSANGGNVALNFREDFGLVGRAWYASAPGGAVDCYTYEVVGQ